MRLALWIIYRTDGGIIVKNRVAVFSFDPGMLSMSSMYLSIKYRRNVYGQCVSNPSTQYVTFSHHTAAFTSITSQKSFVAMISALSIMPLVWYSHLLFGVLPYCEVYDATLNMILIHPRVRNHDRLYFIKWHRIIHAHIYIYIYIYIYIRVCNCVNAVRVLVMCSVSRENFQGRVSM